MAGAYRGVCIDENQLSPVSAAYSTRVIGNDLQIAMVLIYHPGQYGAANVFKDNILQSLERPAGNANDTFGIYIGGYGNIVEEPCGEYGSSCS